MRKNHATLLFIIDRSGSMQGLEDDTIGGINAVLAENKDAEGTADATIVLFDHEFIRPVDHVDIQEVAPLDRTTYVPRGTTALLDAVGMSVTEEMARQASLPDGEKPEKTIVTIVTDGYENASKEWSYDKVKNLLETVQKESRWVVSFLGANIDAAKEAERIGVSGAFASSYMADAVGTGAVYGSAAKMTSSVRAMSSEAFYDDEDGAALNGIAEMAFAEVRADYARRSGKGAGDGTPKGDSHDEGKKGPRWPWSKR